MSAIRDESAPPATHAHAHLGLWDAVGLVVGIIIGVGIFQTPTNVFRDAPDVTAALVTWLVGGLLALVGALCFAELASAYPRSGGEYVYLTRAFGPCLGFVYAWTQLMIIRPGSIGAVAYIFAIHASALISPHPLTVLCVALGVIAVLTGLNVLGVRIGKHTSNVFTLVKVIGLVGILVIGVGWGNVEKLHEGSVGISNLGTGWFAGAMILVLWTYAGWHEAAYIASEVKDNRRNLPIALIAGTLLVTFLYLAVNVALALGLGVQGAQSGSAAADLAAIAWPRAGRQAMSVLILISAFGALNGMIFTTARIGAAFGEDHPLFNPLTRWSPTFRTPMRALLLEGVISVAMTLGVYYWGKSLQIGAAGDPQENPFEDLVEVTAAVFWFLFLLTGVALFVLRQRDPNIARPFKVPGYPVLPILFCLMCGYMIVGSICYKPQHSLVGLGITLVGLPLYFVQRWPVKTSTPTEKEYVG